MKTLQKPCAACPFSRSVTPGALGGSPVEVYIGQSLGPFMLPCHKTCDFEDPDWKSKIEHNTSQCAGAAVFRANLGVAELLPAPLLRLPADKETVFATHAEFFAHHQRLPLDMAQRILTIATPVAMLLREMRKSGVRNIRVE